MKVFVLVTWGLLLAGMPSTAAAQACAGGRVRVDAHCCWPGQSWSRHDRVCDGVPQCPAGTVEEGEGCVPGTAPATTSSPIITPVPPPAVAAAAALPSYVAARGTVENPIGRRGLDIPLIITGGAVAGVGAVLLVVGGVLFGSSHYSEQYTGFIIMMSGAASFVGGIIPFLIGIAGYTYDLVPGGTGSAQASLRLRLSPSAPGAQVGGSLALEF